MSAPQNFRTAFNGFHREDVVRYLEYINTKHTAQVNQLTSEADFLRAKLESAQAVPQASPDTTALEQERDELRAQVEALQQRCAELEAQLTAAPSAPAAAPGAIAELEAYRRAERAERVAKERAQQVYNKVNGVLADASVKVDGVAAQIGTIADQVMAQLTQLQTAVSGSKQALQEAADTMYAIRPQENDI